MANTKEPVAGYEITQREDGEGFVVPTDEVYGLVCCDCGLVHDVVWSYDKDTNELGMAAKRNDKATKQKRNTAQPQREWVGLTEQDIEAYEIMGGKSDGMLARAVEEKLMLKNQAQKREWVELSDEQIDRLLDITWDKQESMIFFARAVLKLAKELNT